MLRFYKLALILEVIDSPTNTTLSLTWLNTWLDNFLCIFTSCVNFLCWMLDSFRDFTFRFDSFYFEIFWFPRLRYFHKNRFLTIFLLFHLSKIIVKVQAHSWLIFTFLQFIDDRAALSHDLELRAHRWVRHFGAKTPWFGILATPVFQKFQIFLSIGLWNRLILVAVLAWWADSTCLLDGKIPTFFLFSEVIGVILLRVIDILDFLVSHLYLSRA